MLAPCPARAQIVADGVQSEDMYMVVSGSVRVEKASRGELPAAVVNVLEEGHTFGEMSFLDNAVPCASCIADTDNVKVRALTSVPRARPGRH